MNKFDLMNKVSTSTLKPEDKVLLTELILRSNEEWECWPSVERLCQVRGIKHEKNFKGVETYLPGLVTVFRVGRKNRYYINVKAVAALEQFEVTIKHTPHPNTPALEGVNTPATADHTPAVAENTPAVEGANSTKNTTRNSSLDSSGDSAGAPSPSSFENKTNKDIATVFPIRPIRPVVLEQTAHQDTPATEGLLMPPDEAEIERYVAEKRALRDAGSR